MTPMLDDMSLWMAIPIAVLVVLGSTLTLIGAWGFYRLPSFYDRLHAPTLGTSWGTAGVVLASALLASHIQRQTILHELVIGFCITVTIPVTLMLLGRASLYRDRSEGSPQLPDIIPEAGANPDPEAKADDPTEVAKS